MYGSGRDWHVLLFLCRVNKLISDRIYSIQHFGLCRRHVWYWYRYQNNSRDDKHRINDLLRGDSTKILFGYLMICYWITEWSAEIANEATWNSKSSLDLVWRCWTEPDKVTCPKMATVQDKPFCKEIIKTFLLVPPWGQTGHFAPLMVKI